MTGQTITVAPHHPDCRAGRPDNEGAYASVGLDPERCCYCAALIRAEVLGSREDPLDSRYGGPNCGCKPLGEEADDA